jgi:hypothetical protein
MNVIVNPTVTLDPQLRRYADTALELMRLEALQAVAAHKDPSNYPAKPRKIRVRNSDDQHTNVGVFVDKWMQAMPAEKRARVLAGFDLDAHLTPELKAAMRHAKLDLKSPTPVLEQVNLQTRFSFVDDALIRQADAARRFDEPISRSGMGDMNRSSSVTGMAASSTNSALKLRVHKVFCRDETTTSEWASKDQINLGGSVTDDKSNTTAIPQFYVGEFKDGGQIIYKTPKILKTFKLSGAYPKTFIGLITIAEIDSGGFSTFIADLVNAVDDEIKAVMTAAGIAAGAAIGGTVGGPVGALIGAVGVLLVGEIIDLINKIARDECFTPMMTAVRLESASHRFTNGSKVSTSRTFTFRGYNGEYVVTYSWELD